MEMEYGNLFSGDIKPDFIPKDADIDELRKQVRRIILPDGVRFNARWYLKKVYPNLEKISISVRDYLMFTKNARINSDILELRMPKEGKLMQTQKIEKALKTLIPKYAYHEIKVTREVKDAPYNVVEEINLLYMAYTRASFAWTEDLTLTCIVLTGLENGAVSLKDIKPLVDEDILNVAKAYMEAKRKSIPELANHIKNTPLLASAFAIYKHVDKLLKIADNEELYSLINNELDFGVDIGLKFKCDVTVKGTAMRGFDGYGSLKHCEYQIRGESTPEINLELIRLTSKYPQRMTKGRTKTKDECKQMEKANLLPIKPSYLIPDFEFLGQSWFGEKANGSLWSFPNGTIYYDGIIKDTSISVASITTELCYLSQLFKNLTLEIQVSIPFDESYLMNDYRSIQLRLINGKVEVDCDSRHIDSYMTDDPRERAEYNRLFCEGKPLLDQRTIEYMSEANKLDQERYENDESKARLREHLNEYGGDFAFMAILHYMKTTYGWTPAPVLDYNYMHHMTTFLFDVDVDKLERLVDEKSTGNPTEAEVENDELDEVMSFRIN